MVGQLMSVEFWAALAGAAVGGGASLGGSVIVNRREVRRGARYRLHDELLPELEASIDRWVPLRAVGMIDRGDRTYAEPPPVFVDVLAATRRAAVLAGRDALSLVDRIAVANKRYLAAKRVVETGAYDQDADRYEGEDERDAAHRDLVEEIRALATWVERKVI